MPLDLRVPGPGGLELGGVDDLHQPAVDGALVGAGEDHPHQCLRLGQTAGLDDDDVDARRGAGEPGQHLVQVAGVDGAAQTAVAQGDHRVDLPGHRHGVDLDAAEVVDDHTDPAAPVAGEEVVEQGGLPRPQESRQDDDRDPLPGQARASIVPVAVPWNGCRS